MSQWNDSIRFIQLNFMLKIEQEFDYKMPLDSQLLYSIEDQQRTSTSTILSYHLLTIWFGMNCTEHYFNKILLHLTVIQKFTILIIKIVLCVLTKERLKINLIFFFLICVVHRNDLITHTNIVECRCGIDVVFNLLKHGKHSTLVQV